MARTAETILKEIIGQQAITIAQLQATIEAQVETIQALKLKCEPSPPTA